MATTQLFVELLIIGIGAAIWLALLLGAIFGYRMEMDFPTIGAPAMVALAGVAYVLGILVDRLAYKTFRRIERRLSRSILDREDFPAPQILERQILASSEILGAQIQYNRSRLRICRAWVFNGAFITIAFIAWNLRVQALDVWQSIALSVLGVLLCISSAWAARTLAKDHYNNLKESYEYLKIKQSTPSP